MGSIFKIADFRGGVNDSDSPTLISDNQLVAARNVDFRDGALGAKRLGTEGIDVSGSTFNSPLIALFRHTPTNSIGNDELWGIDANGNLDRRVGGTWQGGVSRINDFVTIAAGNYDANAVSLHGKLFIAAKGTEDRLLVWDGTVLRWAGISEPPDASVANSAVAGSYSGTRYFRIRFVAYSAGGVLLRRSEPSDTWVFAPSGVNSGAVITKPAGTELATSIHAQGQTHWEIEASIDNILFYRIATVAIGTSTYTDTTAYTTGYSANPLSEQIGEYLVPGAAKHVAVDEDRVVFAGNHFSDALDSTVWWTPVEGANGVGNDERIPDSTRQYISFDGLDGGGVTAVVPGVTGSIFVFKLSRIYRMVRTGIASSAYDPITESLARGALMRGAVAGTDLSGVPCVYFLDPNLGLCRLGQRGLEDQIAHPIRRSWKARNTQPTIGPRMVYYPALEQVWYAVPESGQSYPSLLFVHEARYGGNLFHDSLPASARALALFPDPTTGIPKPVIGTVLTTVTGGGQTYVHRCDSGVTDSGTPFSAYIRTKPYSLGDLWSRFGLMAAVLLARASAATLSLTLIRNFGVEERAVTVSLASVGSEEHVIRPVDNASMSELNTVQIEMADPSASSQAWSLDQLVFKVRAEEGSAG